jgi:hypothetical protein
MTGILMQLGKDFMITDAARRAHPVGALRKSSAQ